MRHLDRVNLREFITQILYAKTRRNSIQDTVIRDGAIENAFFFPLQQHGRENAPEEAERRGKKKRARRSDYIVLSAARAIWMLGSFFLAAIMVSEY